jgi:hypothetical protein
MKAPPLWAYFAAAGLLLAVAVALYLMGRADAAAGLGGLGGLGLGGAVRAAVRVSDAKATVREQVVASRKRQASERLEARTIEAQVKRAQAESARSAVDRLNERFPADKDGDE